MASANGAQHWIDLTEQVQEYIPHRHEVHTEEPTDLSWVTASVFLHEWHQRKFESKALALMLDRIAADIVGSIAEQR